MPSEFQSGTSEESYDVWERAFSDESDISPNPLLRGVRSLEEAKKAHRKAHKYGASKSQKEYIAKLIQKYKNDG